MTVQLSVIIWTVINFCLLMLVLNKLLFKPLLAFMDRRSEKIENIRANAEAAALAREAAKRESEERAANALIERKKLLQEAVSVEIRIAEQAELESEREKEKTLLCEKERIKRETDAVAGALVPRIDELAAAFAEKLTAIR